MNDDKPATEVAAELAERLNAVIDEYEGASIAVVIGALEIVKMEIILDGWE